jgi:hypothetical protein
MDANAVDEKRIKSKITAAETEATEYNFFIFFLFFLKKLIVKT